MTPPNSLSALIQSAETQIQKMAEAKPAAKASPFRSRLVLSAVLAIIIAYALVTISRVMLPPAEKQVVHDLELVVERAQELVDGVRKDTGQLPNALPNAALASVVRYEPDADNLRYKLSAVLLGVRVTLEPDGRKTTEIGIRP